MQIADFLGWWYSRGWGWVARQFFVVYIKRTIDFFSISELLKTLFAPFRQDMLQTKGAPLSIKLQAFAGNVISRFFGFIVRISIIGVGVLALITCIFMGALVVVGWPVVPIGIIVFPIIIGMVG